MEISLALPPLAEIDIKRISQCPSPWFIALTHRVRTCQDNITSRDVHEATIAEQLSYKP